MTVATIRYYWCQFVADYFLLSLNPYTKSNSQDLGLIADKFNKCKYAAQDVFKLFPCEYHYKTGGHRQ
ncbi:hypothetical protein D1BOALGB6SA_9360 [Olavius sp. associated proteobacterium Delta 1]|nr:hypothetical protein D1BOALGB6SA_9360 [Olavius sp. associated proteobacterium Delta 1]